MTQQSRPDITDYLERLGDDEEYEAEAEAYWASDLGWGWLADPAAVAAFDRLCALVQPGTEAWAEFADALEDLAEEYADDPVEELVPVLGEAPTAVEFGRWLFSRAATVPASGSRGRVGQWVHHGTGTHRGVTFTAFAALGVEEHFAAAVASDADGDWVVAFSPV